MTFHEHPITPAHGSAPNGKAQNAVWLDVAAMLSDVAFETDEAGRFLAFGRDTILGFPADQLIGRNIADWFVLKGEAGSDAGGFGSVFATLGWLDQVWRGVVTVERADGSLGNYQIFLGPKLLQGEDGADPAFAGAYGQLLDLDSRMLNLLKVENGRERTIIDAQTGVWSLPSFALETGRRFDRLDVANQPGTLLLLGFLNATAIGQSVVVERMADELRETIRPTDILGRVNATVFGVWCDGMDHPTAVKRAERFCGRLPALLPGGPSISVGIVIREPENLDEPETLIARAQAALQKAEAVAGTVGKGTWRMWGGQASERLADYVTAQRPIVST